MANAAQGGTGLERVGTGGALERVSGLMGNVRGRWSGMAAGQRKWIVASALLVAGVCAAMTWYAGKTDWRVLYSGLESKDVQQIAQELSAAGIPYEVTEDGSGVKVGSDMVDKARMEVATKGMPQSGRMGFELFDKPNWVGSEFDEKVNYQRAMEGELEHTIGTLGAVRSARVHLVLPKETMFAGEQHEAKASVVLKLKRASLPPEQAESIRNLVAGAVENLNAEQVTLVDADGRANFNTPSKSAAEGDAERALQEKLVAMLEPTVGRDNVRATVNVSYDESSQERTDEIYDPAQTATLTMQKTSQTMAPGAKAGGVPGTVSNSPQAQVTDTKATDTKTAGAVPPLMQTSAGLPVYPQAGGGATQTSNEESGTYGVTKHLVHEERGPGRIRRITAAIVVNDRMMAGDGKAAKTTWKPRSTEEMTRLEQLAKAAVGFETGRGDEVVVENVGFSSNVPEVPVTGSAKILEQAQDVLHSEPGLLKSVGMGALVVLLVMVVVRPLTRTMVTAMSMPAEPRMLAASTVADAVSAPEQPPTDGVSLGGQLRAAPALRAIAHAPGTVNVFEQVSQQIRKEPAQSRRLLETWIAEQEEGAN
jgi:flagellar M-ring protein FliF